MASVLCLTAGGESATAVPETGELQARMTSSLVPRMARAWSRQVSRAIHRETQVVATAPQRTKDKRAEAKPDLFDGLGRFILKTKSQGQTFVGTRRKNERQKRPASGDRFPLLTLPTDYSLSTKYIT